MEYKQEQNIKKIKEFLDLVENHKIELRHYKTPILVWGEEDGTIYYSFWEASLLEQFGLKNVDGWDFKEDALFCPYWMTEDDDDDLFDDDDDDDDDDLMGICKIVFPKDDPKS
ncbi:MAG: hypothetical protein GX122_05125 [Candidatus Cloacimonetes bacterium]|nr:hypothetical protein [Candidatus Cloacimonadota bacterium]NLO11789.1 hypothetical protein [Candidatus Cloacimonadota bacterium]